MEKIALGGGCHWCTEAVFQNLKGVHRVDQGFVASYGEANEFSEAVIIHFNPAITGLETLIRIHLKTHSSSSNHTMRIKYRSAIYTFSEAQEEDARKKILDLSREFPEDLIIKILPFRKFEQSSKRFRNYYSKDPGRPFCRKYIEPKLELIRREFPSDLNN